MKNNVFLSVSLLALVGGYFLFFFETEAQKEKRLAEEEQARIEELGKWSIQNRVVTSNRELAREFGMEIEEYTKRFGDLSSRKKDLHYEAAMFLSTIYPGDEDKYVMTVSYGQVKNMSFARISIPTTSNYYSFKSRMVMEKGELNENTLELLDNLTYVSDNKCLGKVCFITLEPFHIKLLSTSGSFDVTMSGWYYGSLSGDRISTSTEYEIPTRGLINHLSERMQFDDQKIDQVQVAKEYLCNNDESFCNKSH